MFTRSPHHGIDDKRCRNRILKGRLYCHKTKSDVKSCFKDFKNCLLSNVPFLNCTKSINKHWYNVDTTFTFTKPKNKARRTQTNDARLYLAEPYSNKDQVVYAMNNAEPLCAGVWQLEAQMFSIIFISRLVHMREISRLCHKWLNY